MQLESAEPFASNWAYLKAELTWLERLLMLAVARQRKESKEVERLAQTRADRATSHWWKGVVSLEGTVSSDTVVERRSNSETNLAKVSHQQQMESRIRVSQRQGIILALPSLCERFDLTPFEKNLVLMSLAPEVNRRYAQIYSYLQGRDQTDPFRLPSVELALRLLCRNDGEWRSARSRLTTTSPLRQYGLLEVLAQADDPFLNRLLKLSDPVVNFLLAEQPHLADLERLMPPIPVIGEACLTAGGARHYLETLPPSDAPDPWQRLVLPEPLLTSLRQLGHRLQFALPPAWGESTTAGSLTLLVGPAGTGKTLAASALASQLQTPLHWVDLALVPLADYATLLQELSNTQPKVLLIQSAQFWLGRANPLAASTIHQFCQQRRAQACLTLLVADRIPAIPQVWRSHLDGVLEFPQPDRAARLRLWQQAFPAALPLASDIDWPVLARHRLTAQAIGTIARDAVCNALAESCREVGMVQIRQALLVWKQSHRK